MAFFKNVWIRIHSGRESLLAERFTILTDSP